MNYNGGKLIVIAVLALALIAAIIFAEDAELWAVPLLTMLVGYVIGNSAVTSQQGNVSPVVQRLPPPPPAPTA